MSLVFESAERGFRDIRIMDSDPFNKLKTHYRWTELKSMIALNRDAYIKKAKDYKKAKLITSDVPNFWKAYDLAVKESDYHVKRSIYLNTYFNKASKGLRDFTFLKMPSGIDQFVEFVESHRPYYDGIRNSTLKAISKLSDFKTYLQKVDSLISNATFLDYYFVIGCHTSFGTVSLNGSLIGLENVIDNTTPIDGLPEFRKNVVQQSSFLPFVLIHELMHNYQNTSTNTLLRATIVEGGADFLTELIAGKPNPLPEYRIYGELHEKEIFDEFIKNLENTNHINWISGIDEEKKK